MMNCDKAKQLLSDYLDKTLEPGVKKEIDDFLENNEECRKIFAEAVSVQKQLQTLPKVAPSEEFEINLRNRIKALDNKETQQSYLGKKGLSLAFSGVAVVVALYMFVFSDTTNQRNISNEILPSSTMSNSDDNVKPVAKDGDNNLVAEEESVKDQATETDSLKNPPEKVDQSGIHLTGDNK